MGIYLNSKAPYNAYYKEYSSPYFVDKSRMLEEVIPQIGTSTNYICVTRPRRFGKSIMAAMLAAFFSKGAKSEKIFDHLDIAKSGLYPFHQNHYNVIFIAFNKAPSGCSGYDQYIQRIEAQLKTDLIREFPEVEVNEEDAVWDILLNIYEASEDGRFIFILDEWDYIFHRDFITEDDKIRYVDFLSSLLKDMPYVSLAYMTGILPIAKYSSGSELNMFQEYTMTAKVKYSQYFGFTDREVDDLYHRYLTRTETPEINREQLRFWYDGYQTPTGTKLYNPRSVVCALTDNQLSNYWTSAGPYDEIYNYINHNIADVRDDLARMVSGMPVMANVTEYAATTMRLTTKDEIFSAMVVYGFLSFENGYVSIPNKELMDKFREMLVKESSLGYVHQLAKASSRMLKATLENDTETMVQILEFAHNTEIPLFAYNSESELTAVVNLVYLQARNQYRIEREDKAGVGYVDFIFYPEWNYHADGIILELKVDDTADAALRQIRDRKYALKFEGRLAEKTKYTGRILGVGIAYNKKTKQHTCKVEVLREGLLS